MPARHLHFLGITGHTMRGVALAAKQLGYAVSGTDVPSYSVPGSDPLDKAGVAWSKTAEPSRLEGVDLLIISGGTAADDVMLEAAKERGIPVQSYAEFVGELAKAKHRIVVSGTHGKTTITSLIAWLLESAGRHPDYLVGVTPRNFSTSVRLSAANLMVFEGDEYRASAIDERSKFGFYKPEVLVITSLEMDHPDMFKDIADIRERFREVIDAMPETGLIVYWAGSDELGSLIGDAKSSSISYGDGGDYQADHVAFTSTGIAFDMYKNGDYVGHFSAPLFGRHNINNGMATIIVSLHEGLSTEEIQAGLQQFRGAARRFSIISAPQAVVRVIDDYAHHPTEVATTIEAARLHFSGRVIAVLRPHTYSRVKELLPEFREAVALADAAFVAEIEGARESGAATVSSRDIAQENGEHVRFEPDRAALIKRVVEEAQPGDTVLCMTVNGYDGLAEELARASKS